MRAAWILAMAIGAAGCGPEPSWVRRGSGIFAEDGTERVFGVGVARGIKNEGLRSATAENRARGELARTLQEGVFGGQPGELTEGLLANAPIAARHYDVASNVEWVLVSVPLAEAREAWVPGPPPGLGLPETRSPTAASQPARAGALPAQGELRSPAAPVPAAVPADAATTAPSNSAAPPPAAPPP